MFAGAWRERIRFLKFLQVRGMGTGRGRWRVKIFNPRRTLDTFFMRGSPHVALLCSKRRHFYISCFLYRAISSYYVHIKIHWNTIYFSCSFTTRSYFFECLWKCGLWKKGSAGFSSKYLFGFTYLCSWESTLLCTTLDKVQGDFVSSQLVSVLTKNYLDCVWYFRKLMRIRKIVFFCKRMSLSITYSLDWAQTLLLEDKM